MTATTSAPIGLERQGRRHGAGLRANLTVGAVALADGDAIAATWTVSTTR